MGICKIYQSNIEIVQCTYCLQLGFSINSNGLLILHLFASSTSTISTVTENLILAWASANRMSDSSCRGYAVTAPRELPILRISKKQIIIYCQKLKFVGCLITCSTVLPINYAKVFVGNIFVEISLPMKITNF